MYICPTCNRGFSNEDSIAKHSLKCWKEKNPNHISKAAPHSEDIIRWKVNNEVFNFFESLQKGTTNERSND